jgi:hypothetical protein
MQQVKNISEDTTNFIDSTCVSGLIARPPYLGLSWSILDFC